MKKIIRKREKTQTLNIRLTPRERALIQSMAKRFAEGNISNWLRQAAIAYRPFL